MLNTIEEALEDIRQGKMIIVVDDENRENEGDLLMAAEKVTPEAINFMVKYGRGLVCVPMMEDKLNKLDIFPMVTNNTDPKKTAFTVSVDYNKTSTGISAYDRSKTISKLVDEKVTGDCFVRPGHIFPLVAKEGGVLERAGHTEAAVDLARLANLNPAGIICEIMNEDGTMARLPQLIDYAKNHKLKIISIEDLIEYRKSHESVIERKAIAKLPTKYGEFSIYGYVNKLNGEEHVAIVKGKVDDKEPILVRIHSECLTGDVIGSTRCDCGEQFDEAMKRVSNEGKGVIIYMRQEGRGIGLVNKIRAYELQDKGLDTVDANLALGFEDDLREYSVSAQILKDLGIEEVKLMTNNPEKINGIEKYNVKVAERVPIQIKHNENNEYYLKVKKEKMGHVLHF
ncbi:MAG: bifunctional 3,4-dihydroxy-2-butanone-4-phosphate synthase/GTP cyclohydrolase II [Vallitalea sp.]|nr:bifunctional 3,4-dihydroxy-2-butanone-4-phosphate synthase/GTP cyclohydrolase II [Vallitalea sp.]